MPDKICFVLIGYGVKPDYRTGRQLDLDKTYEFLIKPVFDDLDITCVRSCDIPHSGVIDVVMYEHIIKADIVVADLSTLNANAIYELGVRHALRPHSTIVIAEKELPYPFDLNHIVITSYEHLGKDVGAAEVRRFSGELKKMVNAVIRDPKTDSPVYTYLKGLKPPEFTQEEKREIKATAAVQQHDSITALLKDAEALVDDEQYEAALEKLNEAREKFGELTAITQWTALATYKMAKPDPVTALKKALEILKPLVPETTNDPETLGLSGSIYKRLFVETGLPAYLDKAKSYYERGFVVSKNYYNGINLAYLLLASASIAESPAEKTADIINSSRVRTKVREICLKLATSTGFLESQDKVWILLTLAEVALMERDEEERSKYEKAAKAEGATGFELDSYEEQKEKIKAVLNKLES
jgi:hypothetical protein